MARSQNFSSVSMPYWTKILMSSHLPSKALFSSPSFFLLISSSLSATFLLMCCEIFFTLPSLWR